MRGPRPIWVGITVPDAAAGLGLTLALLAAASVAQAQGGSELGSPWPDGHRPPSVSEPAPTDGDAASTPAATDPPPVDTLEITPIPAPPDGAVVPPPPGSAYSLSTPRGTLPAATSGLRLPSTIATRMRALEGDLQALALRGSGYIVDGVVQLLSSGVSIAVGVLFLTGGGATNDAFSAYLFTMGGVGVARGLLTLLVPATPSESAVAYAHPLPLTSYAEARARLRSREGELSGLATAGMVGRIIDGSLGVGVGLAMIPIFVAVGEFDETNPLNYVMLLLAGVSTVTGIITLFSTSDAERRWNGYVELRDRLQITASGSDDDRWLDEHADEDEEALLDLSPDAGPSFAVNVGLGGGSLRVDF